MLHYSTIYKDTACCVESNILAVNRQQFCNSNIKRHKCFIANSNLITFLLPAIHIFLLSVLTYEKGEGSISVAVVMTAGNAEWKKQAKKIL